MAASFACGASLAPSATVAHAEVSANTENLDSNPLIGTLPEEDFSEGEDVPYIYEMIEEAKREVNEYWEAKVSPWIGGLTITGAAYLATQAITWIIDKSRKMKRDAKVDQNIETAADSNAKAMAALESANKALGSVCALLDKVEATSDETQKSLDDMKVYVEGTMAAIAAIKASTEGLDKLKAEIKCLCAMLSEYISSDDEAVRSGVAKKAAEISKAVEGM